MHKFNLPYQKIKNEELRKRKIIKNLILKTNHFQKTYKHIEASFVKWLCEQIRHIIISVDLFQPD